MLSGLVLAARPAAKAAASKAAWVRRDALAASEVHSGPGSRHERGKKLAEWHGRVARSVALQAATEERHLRRGAGPNRSSAGRRRATSNLSTLATRFGSCENAAVRDFPSVKEL